MNNNKNCFDFLRMFFAIDILLAHLGELSQNKNLHFLLDYTNAIIGIKGFFVISGFLVAKSYINTPSLRKYFVKRVKRIVPAYIFVLLLSVLILAFFGKYSVIDYFTDINVYKYLGWNSVFLNFMHPCLPGIFENNLICAVNGALWTLKVEEGFYIALPFIFYFIKKVKKPFVVLITLYFLSLLYWFLMDDYFNMPLLAKQLPGYLAYFVVGIFLYLNLKFVLDNNKTLLLLAISTLLISNYLDLNLSVFYPAVFGTLVIAAAYSFPFLNNLGKFGDFTYGLYIYHFPIIQLFRQYNLFERYNPFLMAIYVILITFLFAAFSWFYIEKRFLDRFKTHN
ncbi:acyltransferase family protein [Flavobacterium degerlachei]|jgi:peptidoglycan/LPS O-acetylase OafA/YrhL|uniref:Peptidoglycan/LPS O-acetylase OafA/YrhL, contains acyltransferase and SGNH-hydrolase domains n=1 Tax=Flavobacterium degerlachei TaxID=229203 RepID=A0A1H2RID3_9FLAO|nr:acyltransferase [Flavobacterium degerlachei]SDW18389.1 Peptidoglycan/LPS O-acetylase OafA/YrhL, contains acyltransferase and SGNH-hydrolase domains [Flavobacterium degerlachei]